MRRPAVAVQAVRELRGGTRRRAAMSERSAPPVCDPRLRVLAACQVSSSTNVSSRESHISSGQMSSDSVSSGSKMPAECQEEPPTLRPFASLDVSPPDPIACSVLTRARYPLRSAQRLDFRPFLHRRTSTAGGARYVSGNGGCHHHGSSSTSIAVIHLTHQKPRRPGATRRAGAP